MRCTVIGSNLHTSKIVVAISMSCCSPRWRSTIFTAYSILPGRSRAAAFQPMLHLFRSDPAHFAGPKVGIGMDPSRSPSPFQSNCRSRRWLARHRACWQTASSSCYVLKNITGIMCPSQLCSVTPQRQYRYVPRPVTMKHKSSITTIPKMQGYHGTACIYRMRFQHRRPFPLPFS